METIASFALAEDDVQMGKYFYSVTFSEQIDALDLVGIGGCKVEMINYKDIAAVVSDYPVTDVKTLRKNLLPYYKVNRAIAETSTVIPARFGQIAKNEEDVLRVLQKNYNRLKAELDRLHAKFEIGVKVFWRVENVFEYIVEQDSALKPHRDKLLRKLTPPNRQEQLEFGLLLFERLEGIRGKIAQELLPIFNGAAVAFKINEPTDEKMVLSGLFLVAERKQDEFVGTVDLAADLLGTNYSVKIDGPWIPFNFIEHIELGL